MCLRVEAFAFQQLKPLLCRTNLLMKFGRMSKIVSKLLLTKLQSH